MSHQVVVTVSDTDHHRDLSPGGLLRYHSDHLHRVIPAQIRWRLQHLDEIESQLLMRGGSYTGLVRAASTRRRGNPVTIPPPVGRLRLRLSDGKLQHEAAAEEDPIFHIQHHPAPWLVWDCDRRKGDDSLYILIKLSPLCVHTGTHWNTLEHRDSGRLCSL